MLAEAVEDGGISARVALEPGFSILVESPLMIPALQAHVMALIA